MAVNLAVPSAHGFVLFAIYYVFLKALITVLYAHFGDKSVGGLLGILS